VIRESAWACGVLALSLPARFSLGSCDCRLLSIFSSCSASSVSWTPKNYPTSSIPSELRCRLLSTPVLACAFCAPSILTPPSSTLLQRSSLRLVDSSTFDLIPCYDLVAPENRCYAIGLSFARRKGLAPERLSAFTDSRDRITPSKSRDDTTKVEVTWRVDTIKRIALGVDILVMRRKNPPTSIT